MPHFVNDVEEIRQRAIQKIEDGAVTSSYGLDKDKAVEVLNEALATEIVCVLRYMHHYFMATGVHGRAASDEFKEHADDERDHADRIAERIQQLGGKPDFNPRSLLERSISHYVEGESLADMIREDLIAERMVIDVYHEMIKYFGNDDPTTRILIENILEDEEEHANDMADLLYVVNPSTGETEVQDPGTTIGQDDKEERMDRTQQIGSRRGNQTRQQDSASAYSNERKAARQSANQDAQEAREALGNIQRKRQGQQRQQPTATTQAQASRKDVQPAHAPGTTGRVMARRGGNNVEPAEDDTAFGGQRGMTRSPKVLQKNRKNRVA